MPEINKTPRGLNGGFTLNVFLVLNEKKFSRPVIKYPDILYVGLSSRVAIIQVSNVRTKTNGKCASEFVKLQLLIVETVGPCF